MQNKTDGQDSKYRSIEHRNTKERKTFKLDFKWYSNKEKRIIKQNNYLQQKNKIKNLLYKMLFIYAFSSVYCWSFSLYCMEWMFIDFIGIRIYNPCILICIQFLVFQRDFDLGLGIIRLGGGRKTRNLSTKHLDFSFMIILF